MAPPILSGSFSRIWSKQHFTIITRRHVPGTWVMFEISPSSQNLWALICNGRRSEWTLSVTIYNWHQTDFASSWTIRDLSGLTNRNALLLDEVSWSTDCPYNRTCLRDWSICIRGTSTVGAHLAHPFGTPKPADVAVFSKPGQSAYRRLNGMKEPLGG